MDNQGKITASEELAPLLESSKNKNIDKPLFLMQHHDPINKRIQTCYYFFDGSDSPDELPCKPFILTELFLQNFIYPKRLRWGFDSEFFSGLTRSQYAKRDHYDTNIELCNDETYAIYWLSCRNGVPCQDGFDKEFGGRLKVVQQNEYKRVVCV
ncbi:Oidioi.mRNA.OKI2018_I69.chr2.g5170.t1.cds [Oikopleura dioica]|uniref:Oidioi.mRNA.OKI2018_I69.chr2.g5170.t1.cds n=1 Tax=Oikopleura dioica TaxID=34765 RepID=A0ABN7T3X9_OIKDI|nr:Oidioi.mRNA.OKI2018_I69.chr2.g5170.t1.cds [Oikopleura dioica]